ncbi:MAG: efflux RND transporter periplasmic adaptor subunit [Bacteroidia bacterium]|nr:efflux RND transporter periplasmic adaptor subunit [Bacteroidia bacterium]
MKKYNIIALTLIVLASCTSKNDIESKKKLLEKYKLEAVKLNEKIQQLEIELGDDSKQEEFLISVEVDTLQTGDYASQSEFQATVESEQNVLLSAENGGAVVDVLVKEGQKVSAGQLLVRLDATIIEAQIAEIKNALDLAENVYGKYKRLREQNIGTEMQYLEAKNRYESLHRQLNSANVRLSKFYIKAPFSGKIDAVMTTVGALTTPGQPLLRLVNEGEMKVVVQVPESYVGVFAKGEKVNVTYPSLGKTVSETIDAVGEVINAGNRTFQVFIRPKSKEVVLKPNLLAVVSADDFKDTNVITIPSQLIKRDAADNPYVFVATATDSALLVHKRSITIKRYGADVSIVESGLNSGDLLIVKGYNSVGEGDKVKLATED